MVKSKGRNEYSDDGPSQDDDMSGDGESFEQLLAESFQSTRSIKVGDEVEATVIGFDNDYVFLDLGTRIDGMLRKGELMRDGELIVADGDKIKVFVTGQHSGTWRCSCKLGSGEPGEQDPQKVAAVMTLEEAFTNNTPVQGKVTAINKGGFEVDIMSLKAFCPVSQIDIGYCQNTEEHKDNTYTFFITQFEEEGGNIVVSRKEYLKQEAKKKADKLWQQVEEGAVYEGTVKSLQPFGAFVDIGGIEGLLHISEISYERINKPDDLLDVGQTLDVAVMEVDRPRRKLSLSSKSLQEDPWDKALKELKVGAEYQGKVVRMKTFGAFIQLFPGVDGMVHISCLGTGRSHKHPKEVLNIGQTVPVRILSIEKDNKRISLTMEKQEGDYRKDLKNLEKEQDQSKKSSQTAMGAEFDKVLGGDE